jgi:hypothetical protein
VGTEVSGSTPTGSTSRANQRVDQAGLAAFELADHRDLQPQGPQPIGRLGGQVGHVGHADSSRCLRQGRQRPLQHWINGAGGGGVDTRLHLYLPVRDGACTGRSHQPEGGHSELHR